MPVITMREALNQADVAVDARQAAAAVLDVARDHFGGERRSLVDVVAENGGFDIRAQSIDVVDHEVFQVRPFLT